MDIATGPTKLAKPSRPRGVKHTQDELKFKELVKIVYGEHPGHYAEGEWTEAAVELMQREGWNSKNKEMAKLTEKVRRLFSLLAECSSHRRLRLTRATPHSSRRSLLHDSPPLTTLTTHYSGDGQR